MAAPILLRSKISGFLLNRWFIFSLIQIILLLGLTWYTGAADNQPAVCQHGLLQYPVDIILDAFPGFRTGMAGVTGYYFQIIDPDNFRFNSQLLQQPLKPILKSFRCCRFFFHKINPRFSSDIVLFSLKIYVPKQISSDNPGLTLSGYYQAQSITFLRVTTRPTGE